MFNVKNSCYKLIVFPVRLTRYLLNLANTYYYKMWLKSCGKDTIIQRGVKIIRPWEVSLGDKVIICQGVEISSEIIGSSLIVNNRVQINKNVKIDYSGDLLLAEDVLISENTVIYTHSHGYNPRSKPIKKPLTIGANSWIGSGVTICDSCDVIGDKTIIGSGSIITKSIASNSLAVGSPGKVIKKI